MSTETKTEGINIFSSTNAKLRIQLRRTARLALLSGKIYLEDYQCVLDACRNPLRNTHGDQINLIDEVAAEIEMQLLASGRTADYVSTSSLASISASSVDPGGILADIDWDKLREFIAEILPIIIKLIQAILLII